MSEWDDGYYEDEPDGFGSGCSECGGRGYVVRCVDDLCHGQDECIHGDPPTPCSLCNPKGEKEDALYS
jgi:hypothetical protein